MFRNLLIASIAFVGLTAFAFAQSGYRIPSGTVLEGHQLFGGKLPAVSGATILAGSSDWFGQVTASGTSAITITFAVAFAVAPVCWATDGTTRESISYASTTTTLVIQGMATSDKITYGCFGTPAN